LGRSFLARTTAEGADLIVLRTIEALSSLGGLILSGVSAEFLYKESKNWNLRRISAEMVISSGMVLGLTMILAGVRATARITGSASYGFRLIEFGVLMLSGFFGAGLCIAFWPRLPIGRKNLSVASIEERYVLDRSLLKRYDEPEPREVGGKTFLTVKTKEGKMVELPCLMSVYELASVGDSGTAEVTRGKITKFRVGR